MRFIIFGGGKKSIGIAKACLPIAEEIFIYDKDERMLMVAKKELDKYLENKLNPTFNIKYGTILDIDSTKNVIVFDSLIDREKDTNHMKKVYKKLPNVSVFFTTSKLYSVTYVASLTYYPNRVVGLQFFNSLESVKVVELIKGIHTSSKVLEDAQVFFNNLNKDVIIIKDSPGYLLNRLLLILINESISLLDEGVATPRDIDKEMELELGMEIGPLQLADQIGLDNILNMLTNLYEETGNPKFLPSPLLKNMVHAGYLGIDSNAGFFSYSADILKFPYLKS